MHVLRSHKVFFRTSANLKCDLAGLSTKSSLLFSLNFFVSSKVNELRDKHFQDAHQVCEDVLHAWIFTISFGHFHKRYREQNHISIFLADIVIS